MMGQKTIDIIQWGFIALLSIMLIIQGVKYQNIKNDLVTSEEYNKKNTYIRIYESQKLNKLKQENKELYDSIAKLKNVESGMIIEFHEHYNTDTITVDKFTIKHDTLFVKENNTIVEKADSVYHYTQDNDTIKLDINVKAKELKWITADFTIYDKFVITNREKDGTNQTSISHSGNSTIDNTAMWHRDNEKKWYQRFVFSPQVGAGYGTIHQKFDIYVGFGIGYQFK